MIIFIKNLISLNINLVLLVIIYNNSCNIISKDIRIEIVIFRVIIILFFVKLIVKFLLLLLLILLLIILLILILLLNNLNYLFLNFLNNLF